MLLETWFNMDYSRVIWSLNGLETYVTRVEILELDSFGLSRLIVERLTPLMFLSMPVHDEPDPRY